MAVYRGKLVEVSLGGVDISGDGRSVTFEESADALDGTVYGADSRTKIAGLTDASGSMEGVDATGSWGTGWQAIEPGSTGTLIVYPEGNTSGKRTITATVVVTGRSLTTPYDDIATFSMSFEVSGDVTESTV